MKFEIKEITRKQFDKGVFVDTNFSDGRYYMTGVIEYQKIWDQFTSQSRVVLPFTPSDSNPSESTTAQQHQLEFCFKSKTKQENNRKYTIFLKQLFQERYLMMFPVSKFLHQVNKTLVNFGLCMGKKWIVSKRNSEAKSLVVSYTSARGRHGQYLKIEIRIFVDGMPTYKVLNLFPAGYGRTKKAFVKAE